MLKKISVLFFCAISVFAAESLVSNFTFAVAPGLRLELFGFLSRGDAGSGVTLVTLALGESQVNVISRSLIFLIKKRQLFMTVFFLM
jgi:primosomal replication protein N